MIDYIKQIDTGLALFISGFTLLGFFYKFILIPKIENTIYKRTDLIQPDSNGGRSLPDIALLLGELKSDIKHIDKRVAGIEKCLKNPLN